LADARRRFRSRAFFQKQLSTTTRNTSTTTDEITGIAAAEALDRRREIDLAIDNTRREITTAIQRLAGHWQTRLEREQARTRVEDLKKRIQNITERLREEGVSVAHLEIIADAPRHARGRSYLGQVNKHVESERQRLTGVLSAVLQIPMDQFADITTFPELAELAGTCDATRGHVVTEIEKAIGHLSTLAAAYGQALEAFTARDRQFAADHAAAVNQQQAHKSLLDENDRLGQELAAAEARESQLASNQVGSERAAREFADVRSKMEGLLSERRHVLSEAADQVVNKSSGILKATLKRDPILAEYVKAICGLMEAAHVPDAEARCAAWIAAAIAADQENAWTQICSSLAAIYQAKIAAGMPTEPTEHIIGMIRAVLVLEGNITARQINRIYSNLGDGTVGAALSATPNDYIVMTYVDEGRDIAFSKASPGQQASALLELLLHQSAGTLIIDQPEDDLDNRVIMRIVEIIRTSKNHRQLIFATHNPNIVVNGDADKVIALRSGEPKVGAEPEAPRVQLSQDGAIETTDVRDAITRIMEGGKEAFDLRSRKYRFDAAR
jgi:chromosome segregation protein